MIWHVRRITALRPQFPPGFPSDEANQAYRLVGIRRNEIQGTIAPRTVDGWIKKPESFEPYLVDSAGREGAQGQNRTQRNSLVLHHVAYLIEASPKLTDRANRPRITLEDDEEQGPDTETKYVAMFNRRVAKGQCFHRPCLGIREFACHFARAATEMPLTSWTESLGFMLYDLHYGNNGVRRPGFFDAKIHSGVLHCDTQAPGPHGEPAVKIFGWDQLEANA
jgi:CRISPR-associated protein Cas5d